MDDFPETPAIGEGQRLRAMASAIGGEIGHAFLTRVVAALRDAMDAELVFITIGNGHPPDRARAIFALQGGAAAESFEYALEGTPCKRVYGGSTIVIPKELAERFPKEEGLEGYVGVPIRAEGGAIIGHFAALSTSEIGAPDAAQSILQIFGARVEADLRHRALNTEREALISDLVRVNDTLRTRSQALHDANQFKTGLLGMIAHDLRNPLAVLVAKAELLETRLGKEVLDRDRATRDVQKILDAADRLTGIIEATLTRCRAESSEIELRRRATDIPTLARIALETNRDEAQRKRITLIGPSDGEVWLDVDEGLCLEAIDNLVSNAIKYSPADTRVDVRVCVRDPWVEVSVTDQGQGLSEADLRRAFHPFQTLSAQPTGGETATGLGLVNVRRVAESHGGEALVESDGQGLGATFRFRLPARSSAVEGPTSAII